MQLQLIYSKQINRQKWNDCLVNSSNQLIYASMVYLDCMAENWDAVIADDYTFIMPVPWRKKFGIKYCCNIPFAQQLGMYGKKILQDDVDAFCKFLCSNFKYGDYVFNYMNNLEDTAIHNNYILSLASNYKSTSFFYGSAVKSNLDVAARFQLHYETARAGEVIRLFVETYSERMPHVLSSDYKNFAKLCSLKSAEGNLIVRKVSAGKTTLAAVLFLKDKCRLYNLMFILTGDGRKKAAGYFLFDNVIKEFSQSGLVLDFRGSDLPGAEKFNKSFGAIPQTYSSLQIRALPFPLNFLKR